MPEEPSSEVTRRLNRAIIAASERCQSDIAQSVHGTLCQSLSGASLMVKVLAMQLKAGNPVNAAQLDELGAVLDRALDEARHVFAQLQPVAPGQDGLMTSLARLAGETSAHIPCDFECETAVFIDDPETALALYRIAAEAVKNAVTHAHAQRIRISLSEPDGVIALRVSDDGCGFVPQPPGDAVRGRDLMRSRAQTAGGSFTSESESGQGTTVTFTLPKAEPQA